MSALNHIDEMEVSYIEREVEQACGMFDDELSCEVTEEEYLAFLEDRVEEKELGDLPF